MTKKRPTHKPHHPAQGQNITPQTRAQQKRQAQRELWLSVGIVAAIILAFVLLYYFTVTRPAQVQSAANNAETPPITLATATLPSVTATAGASATGQPTPTIGITSMQWSKAPAMSIDPKKTYQAVIKTVKGDITIQLYADKAPITVNNFVFLARQGFYNGVTFHRVISGFMAQTGDPTGTGSGGPGYQFADEINQALKFDTEGIMAMANAGPGTGTNGSQFFITYAPQPGLNGGYSIFGKVLTGMDVLRKINPRDPAKKGPPGDQIISVEIIEK
jgi:cyclophilin family peptidyl-prolyl cis-trans isomerase